MDKTKFEQDILEVLKKHGYKIEGIKQINLNLEVSELPEIDIEYIVI